MVLFITSFESGVYSFFFDYRHSRESVHVTCYGLEHGRERPYIKFLSVAQPICYALLSSHTSRYWT